MSDEGDIANEITEHFLDVARSRIKHYSGESLETCAECDEVIPEKRRIALPGVRLCIECQEVEDRENELRRRTHRP